MSRPTLDPALSTSLSLTGLSPSLAGFPKTVLLGSLNQLRGPNPGMHASRFGLFPFRSLARRYFGNRCFFLFLRLLRCFSSPGSLCIPMDSACSDGGLLRRVSPFRHLRINGYLLLPEAFRSLSRLSSALSAKASTIRSFMHDQLALKAGGGFSPLYSSKTHTYIALYALVFGQFFALFSSKCVIITQFPVITITSDVLIKIF